MFFLKLSLLTHSAFQFVPSQSEQAEGAREERGTERNATQRRRAFDTSLMCALKRCFRFPLPASIHPSVRPSVRPSIHSLRVRWVVRVLRARILGLTSTVAGDVSFPRAGT